MFKSLTDAQLRAFGVTRHTPEEMETIVANQPHLGRWTKIGIIGAVLVAGLLVSIDPASAAGKFHAATVSRHGTVIRSHSVLTTCSTAKKPHSYITHHHC